MEWVDFLRLLQLQQTQHKCSLLFISFLFCSFLSRHCYLTSFSHLSTWYRKGMVRVRIRCNFSTWNWFRKFFATDGENIDLSHRLYNFGRCLEVMRMYLWSEANFDDFSHRLFNYCHWSITFLIGLKFFNYQIKDVFWSQVQKVGFLNDYLCGIILYFDSESNKCLIGIR